MCALPLRSSSAIILGSRFFLLISSESLFLHFEINARVVQLLLLFAIRLLLLALWVVDGVGFLIPWLEDANLGLLAAWQPFADEVSALRFARIARHAGMVGEQVLRAGRSRTNAPGRREEEGERAGPGFDDGRRSAHPEAIVNELGRQSGRESCRSIGSHALDGGVLRRP